MMFKSLMGLSCLPLLAQAASLQEVIAGNANLTALASLITSMPNVSSMLPSIRNATLFAPSNDAIAKFMNSTDYKMMSTMSGAIEATLQYHIAMGSWTSSQLPNGTVFAPTMLSNMSYTNVTGGQRVEIIKKNNKVSLISGLLRNSTVTQADIPFDGGVIHIIDSLLTLPPNVMSTLEATSLSAAYGAIRQIDGFQVVDSMPNITVFVPNNAAFAAIGSIFSNITNEMLDEVLGYHMVVAQQPIYSTDITMNMTVPAVHGGNLNVFVNNGSIFVNNAKVVTPNILVANGVVHIIDAVLNPMNATATPTGTAGHPGFSGASSVSATPFTSGVPTASVTTGAGGAGVTGTSTSTSTAGAAAMTGGLFGAHNGGLAGALVGAVGMAALMV